MAQAHVIVVGNEKGGTGKSTLSMHIIVALLHRGLSVASIDVDARQGTLTRYLENRKARTDRDHLGLLVPEHRAVPPTADPEADAARLVEIIADLRGRHDVLVIDTPGSDHALSRLAHTFAQSLVTPLNDSLIDLDVLAHVDPATMHIAKPSLYAELVWDTKKQRAMRGERAVVDWVVVRNRLSSLDARNKRDMEKLLTELSRRIGFRLVPGLGERVIYRSLFLEGLTLLDLRNNRLGFDLNMSHVAARQELRGLIDSLGLDAVFEAALPEVAESA
jgi:chromosome partitioning protein